MTELQTNSHVARDFRPLLELALESSDLDDNWVYCDLFSSFISRMVSHNRSDPFLFANLLSATLNELFETVYRTSKEHGQLRFSILRDSNYDRIEIEVPCGQEEQEFYITTISELASPDSSETYLDLMFSEQHLDRRIGLYELAVSYGAKIGVENIQDKSVVLTVEIQLEYETD